MKIVSIPREIVRNFPPEYPLYKKIVANIFYSLFGLILFPRKNLLTNEDITKIRSHLRKGDILLLGNLQSMFSKALKDPITHTALLVSKRTVIHAFAHGVEKKPLKEILATYDTVIVLRLPRMKGRAEYIRKATSYMKSKFGTPYNFYFQNSKNTVFCSALVNDAFLEAGYKTGITTFKDKRLFARINGPVSQIRGAVRPKEFVTGNFTVVCSSHNILVNNKSILFIEDPTRIAHFITSFTTDPKLIRAVVRRFDSLIALRKSFRKDILRRIRKRLKGTQV